MTKYREIIRLSGLGLSQTNIALSCNASKTTVNKVLKAAREQNLSWPLVFCQVLFPEKSVGIPFFQQGIFPAFSGHYASLRMRACSIR